MTTLIFFDIQSEVEDGGKVMKLTDQILADLDQLTKIQTDK